MCLAVIALDAHPRYRIVIAANRDEFHARPAVPAHWWTSGMLAGQDLIGGGAWFGVSRSGRWALVTNFREGIPRDPGAPSRGELVTGATLRHRYYAPRQSRATARDTMDSIFSSVRSPICPIPRLKGDATLVNPRPTIEAPRRTCRTEPAGQ
jgi:hypothetical protein